MNKSLLTNLLALAALAAGYLQSQPLIFNAGLFALSGALTNWLAVHMLFERVPGLYGSGVIPNRFEDFKTAIGDLIMDQFFNQDNLQRLVTAEPSKSLLPLDSLVARLDLDPLFDSLLEALQKSSLGGMLSLVGGIEAVEPLRQPFVERARERLADMVRDQTLQQHLWAEMQRPEYQEQLRERIRSLIHQRLEELTPELVKEILARMIRTHLGWLVVWGGVFGGLIGLLAGLLGR